MIYDLVNNITDDMMRPRWKKQGERSVAVHGTVDNIHTRRIADYVSGIEYDSVPEEVRERIKLLILDSLGCGLYGAQLTWS
jgi:hypothetical protein